MSRYADSDPMLPAFDAMLMRCLMRAHVLMPRGDAVTYADVDDMRAHVTNSARC